MGSLTVCLGLMRVFADGGARTSFSGDFRGVDGGGGRNLGFSAPRLWPSMRADPITC